MRLHQSITTLALLIAAATQVTAADAPKPAQLNVYPADVQLTTVRDRQSLIVQAEYSDGITRDVTAEAKFALANGDLARLEKNVLYPKADGAAELTIEYAGLSVKVPVEVQRATEDPPISFKLDVMPVFMKSGCNTGSCHGAASGKDGFRLSLFGFDSNGDHHRLTREMPGRRINLAIPEASLLMEKTNGVVPHTGGKRYDMDSEYADTLLRWLRVGAPQDQGEVPKVVAVEIYPKGAVLDGEGATQQINVRAKYSDGTDRDVTSMAYFLSNNDNSAPIEQNGVVTAAKRGESFIMARFETYTVGTHFIVLPKGLDFKWNEVAANNYVDELMYDKFQKLRIQPSELCTDEEFMRRVYLDVVGVLPSVEQYHAFLNDADPKKRDNLVDNLLGRKEFVEMWVMKWAELLQVRTTRSIAYKPMLRYYNWIQERIASNMPMDQLVQELLGASGGTFENAATNYYQMEGDPKKVAENVAQVFMGMRIQCAQCHNHPLDRWTMDDYYSFAAFFSQIGRKSGEDPREQIIFNSGGGEVTHPVGGRRMAPKFLGGEVPDVAGKDRRVVMANWLASPENPYFAKNLANIVWNHFLGQGIINEVDDVRVSNPPVNAELIDALGQKFTGYKYDFKKLVRDICTSRTYQLSTATNDTNATDTKNFSHASLRRIRAEILLDLISQVTDTKNKFGGLPLGARAVQIANGNTSTYFLTTFGRAQRATVCACEVKVEPNLSQALHLLNGDTLQSKVGQGNLIGKRLEEKVAPEQIVEELYIRCLTRRPTEKEKNELNAVLAKVEDKKQVLEDVFWALLNAREFVFNH
ncbi:MAG: cell surface protein [Planctomycetaceae bacterium]|nr:cell surface protein [Planctomycetaceae bacterium]